MKNLVSANVPHAFITAGLIVAFLLGFVVLIENIFMLMSLNGCSRTPAPARRLVNHHAGVLVLQAALLMRGSLSVVMPDTSRSCQVLDVLRSLAESLADWDVVLMGVLGLALRDAGSGLHGLAVRWCFQLAAIGSAWTLSASELALTWAFTEHFEEDGACREFHHREVLVRAVYRVLCFLLRVALVALYCATAKRSAGVVKAEREASPPSGLRRSSRVEKGRTAQTLIIQCSLTAVLTAPYVFLIVVEVALAADDLGLIEFFFCLLVYASYLAVLVVFLARHEELRHHFKVAICQKCFLYQDEKFQHHMDDHYSRIALHKERLKEPEVASEFLTNITKKRSVANMPALQQIILEATGTEQPAVVAAVAQPPEPVPVVATTSKYSVASSSV